MSTETNPSNEAEPFPRLRYETPLGQMYQGKVEDLLNSPLHNDLTGRVQLIFTSPPFPLKRKKKYGNKEGEEYLEWLTGLAPQLAKLLTDDGSLVVEIGNAWDKGKPTMSLLPLQSLMAIAAADELNVCQQFICNNPARLPSPAQWVTIERIRVKDSFTHVWWYSRAEKPKTNQQAVLKPYSDSMKGLLKRGSYNAGRRPSGHDIGEASFLKDNGGAIPPNVFDFSNTLSGDPYRQYVKERDLPAHPAPMQTGLAEWFIKFLTDEGDLVFDPFGGSNTTGAVAEELGRRWVTVEPKDEYIEGSKGRFSQFQSGE